MRKQRDLQRDVAARTKRQRARAEAIKEYAQRHQKVARVRAMSRMNAGRAKATRQAKRSRVAARRAQLVRRLRTLGR